MNILNQTVVREFILIGFRNVHKFRIAMFIFIFLIYAAICIGNMFITCLVLAVRSLQGPMYIFLSNLSMCDVFISTDIVPNMLYMLWTGRENVTVSGCILHSYLFASLGGVEGLILTVMSYDRYLAICHPLSYSSLMNTGVCCNFTFFFWIAGLTLALTVATVLYKMQSCHLNTFDHIYCDGISLLELACSDLSISKVLIFFSVLFTFFPFLLIIASYTYILHAVLRIKSNKGRQKAFSTCSSHLTVMSLFYGTLFILYGVPSESQSINISKMLSLLYIIATPFLNPIIYCLRNQEIARAVAKLMTSLVLNRHSI